MAPVAVTLAAAPVHRITALSSRSSYWSFPTNSSFLSLVTRLLQFMNTAENLGFKSVKLEFRGRYVAVVGCSRVKVHPLDLPALRLASIFRGHKFLQ